MKTFLYLLAGVAAATAYVVYTRKPTPAKQVGTPVDSLAHKLQDAWADHHTIA